MSRPERGKGGRHARENGWLALSTLALQYQRHIGRALRLRADADARREFKPHDPDEIGDRAAANGLLSTAEPGATVKARG